MMIREEIIRIDWEFKRSRAFVVVFKMRNPESEKRYAMKYITLKWDGRTEAYHRIVFFWLYWLDV